MTNFTFTWNMTKEDWGRLRCDDELVRNYVPLSNKDLEEAGFYGNCMIGTLCADIQHTLDESDCYAYANVFSQDVNDGYGETGHGISYGFLCDAPHVPLKADTFEEFKREFEKNFQKYIEDNNLQESANKPLANWD